MSGIVGMEMKLKGEEDEAAAPRVQAKLLMDHLLSV